MAEVNDALPVKQNVLAAIVEKLGQDLENFKRLAHDRFLSWQDHPEYFKALDESYEQLKNHAADFDPEIGKKLLGVVLETRLFFEAVRESYKLGEFKGALLRGLGQEAVGAGIGVAMRPHDILARDHRSVSAAVARGTPILDFWANHLMRATGPTGGYDANVHFADYGRNCLGFLASDMAMAAVITNGAVWYANAKLASEKGQPLLPDERVCGVPIIGDGAASNGLTHGGINFAKAWNLPVMFVILNNQIALRTHPKEQHGGIDLANRGLAYEMLSLTVDGDNAFEVYLASRLLLYFARTTNHPALLNAITFRRAGHNDTERTDYLKQLFDEKFLEFWTSREQDPLYKTRMACHQLGFITEEEYGVFRDQKRKGVIEAHQKALEMPEPSAEEFRTALLDPHCNTAKELATKYPASQSSRKISFKEALQEAFRDELRRDPLLLMLGEDIGWPGGGVFEVTTPLLAEFKERIRNATLDEAAIGGFLVGAGLLGGKVIGEYQFWNFFLAGPSPILTLAATRPFMQKNSARGVLRGPTGYAPQSNHYHESWPETYLLKALGIKVVVPSCPKDAKGLMKSAIHDPDLVAFLEEMSYYGMTGEVPEGEYFTPFEPEIKRPGKDITLITWGPKMVELALTSAEALVKENIDVEVIDLRVLNPLDKEFLFKSMRKTGRVIVLHEDSKFMGFGAEIAASIAENPVFYELRARIIRVAALNTPIPVHLTLEDFRLPNIEKVLAAARTLMEES